jgi:cytochrome c1
MRRRSIERFGAVIALITALCAAAAWSYVLLAGTATERRSIDGAIATTHGDPERGLELVLSSGCGACHEIPGVVGARGKVGPALTGFASRAMIGGVLPNTGDNLVAWIVDPRSIDPKTGMPAVGLTHEQARDVAAYLYARAGS